jgi:uncharacterized membrane protein
MTSSQTFADNTLKTSARLWFVAAILGQLLFAFTTAAYYGLTAMRGDMQAWNRFMMRGYSAGQTASNVMVAMHLVSAVIIILAGALQFVPSIRQRFPAFHRWSGRLYVLTALTLTLGGLYLHWVRGSLGDLSMRIAATINAILIWICAVQAIRYAIARDFKTHRRWTLRLFLVVSAAWFFRAFFFLSLVIFKGPIGFDPSTLSGPFITFMAFAQFVVPLAVVELYFLAQARPGVIRRFSMAAALFVLTIGMSVGVFAVSASVWVPSIKAAFDSRKSLAYVLFTTTTSRGVEQAIAQYRQLKATAASTYNFDEVQLNLLGYQLLRANKHEAAIRIFLLNIEAYPRSSNAYDSLGEAYLGARNKALAVANYRKAVQLNPNNGNSIAMLRKLGVWK